jgi:Nucleotidyltransferase/DNA polymerase involved in DNA repair
MKQRVILHCDIDYCYAQMEEMKYPELKKVPMAVGGSEEKRHGIILAKNTLAKRHGVKTAESLREALAKCPKLLIIHPNYDDYLYYSEKVKDIYRSYSDKVESFGIDEAWVDISDSLSLFGSGETIAKEIKRRIKEELGLTVSIGLSFNKVFAKLGSDLNKPDGLSIITEENYRDIVWPLPVEELFYVGPATKRKLYEQNIKTIGELAQMELHKVKNKLGKMGELVYHFANGVDISEVKLNEYKRLPKSMGNGITTPKDVCSYQEAEIVFYVLVESIAARLKDLEMVGGVISIALRDKELNSFMRQKKISEKTNIASEIMDVVKCLLHEHYDFSIPMRSLSVTVAELSADTGIRQLNLLVDEKEKERMRNLDLAMMKIRNKYGFYKVKRCTMLLDEELSEFNPKEDHVIHPVGYF